MENRNMVKGEYQYAIYPSLLDSFLKYKKADDDETFAYLLDKINKVKTEQTEQQLKGIEFENLVGLVINANKTHQHDLLKQDHEVYETDNFEFKAGLVNKIADKLRGRQMEQNYIEAIINTKVGRIKLYGIVDYRFEDMIVDLKTTGNYKINKYTDTKDWKYTQHLIYPLIRKTMGNPVKAFKYVVTDFENDYQETYIPTEAMDIKLMQLIYEFVAFIEYYKPNITDYTVFGGRKEAF